MLSNSRAAENVYVCQFQPLLDLKVICNLKQKHEPKKMMLLQEPTLKQLTLEAGTQKRFDYTKIEGYLTRKPSNIMFNIFCVS